MKKTSMIMAAMAVAVSASVSMAQYIGSTNLICNTRGAGKVTVTVAMKYGADGKDLVSRVEAADMNSREIPVTGRQTAFKSDWTTGYFKLTYRTRNPMTARVVRTLDLELNGGSKYLSLIAPGVLIENEPVDCQWVSLEKSGGTEKLSPGGSMCRHYTDHHSCIAKGCDWTGSACVPPLEWDGNKIAPGGSMCRHYHSADSCPAPECDWNGACVPARASGFEKSGDKWPCGYWSEPSTCLGAGCTWLSTGECI